jgi:hypothetical protein
MSGWRKRQIQERENDMIKIKFPGTSLGLLMYLAFIVVIIGGWIMNLVEIVNYDFASITGMIILRIAGIFIAPLGAVLGWI